MNTPAQTPGEPPRFVASEVACAEAGDQRFFRGAAATSSLSQADAENRARLLAKARAEAAAHGTTTAPPGGGYPYPTRTIYEPVLERVDLAAAAGESAEIARLTRNAYGATVLNAYTVLFVDVDTAADSSNQPGAKIVPAETAIGALAEVCAARPDLRFRVYSTKAGLRYLCLSRLFDPVAAETRDLLASLHSDPRYALLCRVQKCFRARLTPKPWRCLAARPPPAPGLFGWLKQAMSSPLEPEPAKFATCRFLEVVGTAAAVHPAAQRILEIHDRLTEVASTKPLA
jgi:hypothetical protein